MPKLSILKTYLVVLVIIFTGGIIWSVINGYSYFCEGLKACDQSGEVLEWPVFFERKLWSLLIAAMMASFITFMLLKDKGVKEKGTE